MGSVNKVILLGNLGRDPEMRATAGGIQVATLSIATAEQWVKDGKKEEKTEWHRVVFWDKQAELAGKYLKKGSKVYIEGKLTNRTWEDKDGVKRYSTDITGNQMVFLSGGGDGGGGRSNDPGPTEPPPNLKTSGSKANTPSAPADYGEPYNEDTDVPFN